MKKYIVIASMLLFGNSLTAQVNTPQLLAAWNDRAVQGSAALFFHQPVYSPGDTVFFKTYFSGSTINDKAPRQIIHLDVSDTSGTPVVHANFHIRGGVGANQFVLPAELPAGHYFVSLADPDPEQGTRLSGNFLLKVVGRKSLIKSTSRNVVQFFPESGKLVTGVTNQLTISATGLAGEAFEVRNAEGSIVVSGRFDVGGYATVALQPTSGQTLTLHAGSFRQALPAAVEGSLMRIKESPAQWEVSWEGMPLNASALLAVVQYGSLRILKPAQEHMVVVRSAFHEGLVSFALLDGGHQVQAWHSVWNDGGRIAVNVVVPSHAVSTRQPVSLQVDLRDAAGQPVMGEFSVSVIQELLRPLDERPHLNGAAWGTANPALLAATHEPAFVHYRNFMPPTIRQNAETDALMNFRGIATLASGEPTPDSTRVMVYLQRELMGYEVYTHHGGQFELPFLFDFYGEDDLFYALDYRGKPLEGAAIRIRSHAGQLERAPRTLVGEGVDAFGEYNFQTHMVQKSYAFFGQPREPEAAPDHNAEFEEELGGADVWVNTGDYLPFPDINEVVKVVPALYYRRAGERHLLQMQLSDTRVAVEHPTFFINGVMTRNLKYFLAIDPADLVSLRLVKDVYKLSHLGALGQYGVMIVKTKKKGVPRGADNTVVPILGLSRPVPHASTAPKPAGLPAFGPCLLWQPTVLTDENGHATVGFQTSDDTGKVLIRVEGMTREGVPFSGTAEAEVRYARP